MTLKTLNLNKVTVELLLSEIMSESCCLPLSKDRTSLHLSHNNLVGVANYREL